MNLRHPLLQYSLIFVIVFIIGTYFRTFPLRNYTPGDSYEKATVLVLSQLKAKSAAQVEKLYPTLSTAEKEAITRKLVNTSIRNEKNHVKDAIEKVSKNLFQDSREGKNFPYLLASDSFYYYDLTQRIMETGKISDVKKGSKYLNKRMLAPIGHFEPINWHPFVGYGLYQFLRIFNPEIPLMLAISYTPLLLYGLALIAFIWVCHLLSMSRIAIFIAACAFSFAPSFMKRSMFGWYDNDPYNILFPLLILGLLFHSLIYLKEKSKALIGGGLIAVTLCLYAHFWQGWVFLFSIIFVAAVIILLMYLAFNKSVKQPLPYTRLLTSAILGTFILISLSFGFKEFFILFQEGLKALTNFFNPQLSPWPDLYLSVGELKNTSFKFITDMTGGNVICLIALLGLISSIMSAAQNKLLNEKAPILILAIYFFATIFITLGAQRFVLFCVVPFSLCFGLGIHYIFDKIKSLLENKHAPVYAYTACITIATLILIFLPAKRLQAKIPTLLNPIYNEIWDKALIKIREETPSNSIVNAWWSPGHFIKATANRSVTFDGASINYPQSYWLSNFFLENDEYKALGTLRMLNNSGHTATSYLESIGLSLLKSIKVLNELTKLNRIKAEIVLNTFIQDKNRVNEILKLTHARPAPSYILLYNEFVDNNIQLKFIGNWNFERITELNENPELLKKVPKRNSKEYIDFLWELAGGPHKYSGVLNQIGEEKGLLLFDDNLSIDKNTFAAQINSPKYGSGTPISIFYLSNDKVKEKTFEGADKPFSVVLYQSGNSYKAILMDRFLAQSMLVQMYFFDAKGLNNIKPIIHEHDLTYRTEIKVFEVNWESFERQMKYR